MIMVELVAILVFIVFLCAISIPDNRAQKQYHEEALKRATLRGDNERIAREIRMLSKYR